MVKFLIIYGIMALIFFVLKVVLSTISVARENELFVTPIFVVDYAGALLTSLFFPIYIVGVLAHIIGNLIYDLRD